VENGKWKAGKRERLALFARAARACFALAVLCGPAFSPPAFASGAAEPEAAALNGEWALCVTAFDDSALTPQRKVSAGAAARELVSRLKAVNRRFRSGGEEAYYRDSAVAAAQAAAAKALAAERAKRDALLFQGEPGWKYRKNLKASDKKIAELEAKLAEAGVPPPAVEPVPALRLTEAAASGAYPAPPKAGGEAAFCRAQKADGFLAGEFSEFHGRLYLTVRLYALYAGGYIYEDSALFSPEDTRDAVAALAERLAPALAGTAAARVAVHVTPPDASVLIDNAFAGRGEVPARGEIPGETTVTAYSDGHLTSSAAVTLLPGEAADLYLNLTPLGLSAFTVDVPGIPGARVYRGALYLGETPLSVETAEGEMAYLRVETPGGDAGTAVTRGTEPLRGAAQFVRAGEGGTLAFSVKTPRPPGEGRVEKARRRFYGSWARFWTALPLSLMTLGLAGTYSEAWTNSDSTNQDLYDKAQIAFYAQYAAWGLIGLSLADVVYHVVRYLHTASSGAGPLDRKPAPAQEPEPGTEQESGK
jgi:hypothetical protein